MFFQKLSTSQPSASICFVFGKTTHIFQNHSLLLAFKENVIFPSSLEFSIDLLVLSQLGNFIHSWDIRQGMVDWEFFSLYMSTRIFILFYLQFHSLLANFYHENSFVRRGTWTAITLREPLGTMRSDIMAIVSRLYIFSNNNTFYSM